MFQNSGLSLEQAPPIKVVLRFFLTGSIFGIVASIMLFFWHKDLNNFASPTTLTLVHTLTLGVMASFMLGALFQMMPVVCGVHIKAPTDTALRVNYTLIFGLIFLLTYFINGSQVLLYLSIIFLSIALYSATFIMIKRLKNIEHSNSSRGMLFAIISLVVTITLAFSMLLIRDGVNLPFEYLSLKSIHLSFGLFGWIALLVISVSLQVIEMFYVTPKYNTIYAKYITISISILLLVYAILKLWNIKIGNYLPTLISLSLFAHSLYTLINIKRKKRPVNDASIWFWVVSMGGLLLFNISYLFNLDTLLSAMLFTIFSLGVVFAMVYKIVPFLVWFHLNAKGYFDAPMMHEVIQPKYAKNNFWLFLASALSSLLSLLYIKIYYIASILWVLSFFMLLLSIYKAWHKYQYTLDNGKKFNFPSI